MSDPWAFGWEAIGALGTGAAALAAVALWFMESRRSLQAEADSVFIDFGTYLIETVPIYRTFTDESGERLHALANGWRVPAYRGLYNVSAVTKKPDALVRQENRITIINESKYPIYNAVIEVIDQGAAEDYYGAPVFPWTFDALPSGGSTKVPGEEAHYFVGFGGVLFFTMAGKTWRTEQGLQARRYRVSMRRRVSRWWTKRSLTRRKPEVSVPRWAWLSKNVLRRDEN